MANNEPKQVIIVRKDLNMRKGKMVAQGSHASMKAILDIGYIENNIIALDYVIPFGPHRCLVDWLSGRFTKVCVSVDSEQELLEVYNKAKEKGLLCSLIQDAGLTEFNNVPTLTCCAVGPAYPEDFIGITDHLKLL